MRDDCGDRDAHRDRASLHRRVAYAFRVTDARNAHACHRVDAHESYVQIGQIVWCRVPLLFLHASILRFGQWCDIRGEATLIRWWANSKN